MKRKTCSPNLLVFLMLLFGSQATAWADNFNLVVQPILSEQEIVQAYTPLTEYLSKQTGHNIRLVTAQNFFTYWEIMKRDDVYDLILDAAHLTDFRIQRMDYVPLAKLPDVVSFSLVTSGDNLVFEPSDLIGKRVASLGSPSLAAVSLSQLFDNPMRLPIIVEVNNSQTAIDKLLAGEVSAAIIPTPLVQTQSNLNTVTSIQQVPHMALSAKPSVPLEVQESIRKALTSATETADGQRMLNKLNFERFVVAEPSTYDGYAELLQGVWGY